MRSLSRGRGRDIVERFSLAAQTLVPIIAIILMVPAAIGLGAVGFLAGFWAGQPAGATMLTAVHITLMFACGFTLFAPLVFPASSEASGQLRLLLLPIPAGGALLSSDDRRPRRSVARDPASAVRRGTDRLCPVRAAARSLGHARLRHRNDRGRPWPGDAIGVAAAAAAQKPQARRAGHGRSDAGLHADIDGAVVSRAGLRRRQGKTPNGTARPARTPGRRGSEGATAPARPVGGRAWRCRRDNSRRRPGRRRLDGPEPPPAGPAP